jgi:hypothetical protein
VDCNEDGFTEPNIRAICGVGNSSKRTTHGYIGEKGIGFKSVFMAAWKVHIQSGPYSFSFVHRINDSGMGMVTPTWEDSREELPHPLTRITLFLHEYEDDDKRKLERESIRNQFRGLQAPLLLFLRKLRSIHVAFYDEQEIQEWSTTFTVQNTGELNRVVLLTSPVKSPSAAAPERRVYHVTKYTVRKLAKSENRALSAAEESSGSYATSEVVLASR